MTKKRVAIVFLMTSLLTWQCTSEQEPAPTDCSNSPGLNLLSSTDSNCNQSNGAVTLVGTGGAGDLMYSLSGSAFQFSSTFENLSAGLYTAVVRDINGCTSETEVVVLNSDGMNIDISTTDTECGENHGSIRINATGSTGDVEYQLNGGDFQSSNRFENLPQGGYVVTVRDGSGCEIEQEVDIKTNVTFTQVELIIQKDCVTSGCHDGAQSPDYRGAANIIGNADLIKLRTQNGTMPPDGRTITQAEIDAIACWVDDGGRGN